MPVKFFAYEYFDDDEWLSDNEPAVYASSNDTKVYALGFFILSHVNYLPGFHAFIIFDFCLG